MGQDYIVVHIGKAGDLCYNELQNPDASHLSRIALEDFVVHKFCASEQAPLRCEFVI